MKLNSKTFNTSVLLIALFISLSSYSQNNSTFRGDNEHSGTYERSQINSPVLKWKCNLYGTIFSSPAISGDIAYIGSGNHNLYAINTKNGKIKWTFVTNGAIHSTPAVNNEMVFFVSNDGSFYALDKITGAEKWQFKTEGEKQFSAVNLFGYDTNNESQADLWDFYLSSPIVKSNIVYFGSGDSHIYALNTITGDLVWKFKTGNVVHSSPAISNGIVYCGSFDSKLYALDAITGKEIWSYQTGVDEKYHLMCGIQSSPSVSNGVVYFGSRDAYVYAVEAVSGKLKWKQKFGGSWMPSSTAVSKNKLFVGSSDAKKYFSINKETGEIIHSIKTNSFTFSSPSISGNTAYIGSANGFLYAINKELGTINWIYQTEAGKSSNPKYFDAEGLRTEELRKGLSFKNISDSKMLLDRIYSSGAILSSPVIDKGTLYFSSADGFLYAIN